jgi:hypothetical protein
MKFDYPYLGAQLRICCQSFNYPATSTNVSVAVNMALGRKAAVLLVPLKWQQAVGTREIN